MAARHSLERTNDIGRDPAAIKAAGLWNDLHIVDQALVAGAVYTVFVVGSADAPVGILRKDR